MLSNIVEMLAALLTVGVLAALLAGRVLPLVIIAAAVYVIWHVAKALEE